MILGRICYETWPRVHHEGRNPIVITSRSPEELNPHAIPKGCEGPVLARSVSDALRQAETMRGEVFICGGERIFEETLPLATRLYLTQVRAKVEGDVRFPEWKHLGWSERYHKDSQDDRYRFSFSILERNRALDSQRS